MIFDKKQNSRSTRKPVSGGNWSIQTICIILSLLALFTAYIAFAESETPIFGGFLRIIRIILLLVGIGFLSPIILKIIHSHQSSKKSIDRAIQSEAFDQWLYSEQLYGNDKDNLSKYYLPNVRYEHHAIMIQAIGRITTRLQSEDIINSLNAWLANQGCKEFVLNNYYKNGWVHFVLGDDLDKDRLHY